MLTATHSPGIAELSIPSACDRIALAKANRRLKNPLIESRILRVALTTPAALNARAASVRIVAKIEAAATSIPKIFGDLRFLG
jgi:hypothetical protein